MTKDRALRVLDVYASVNGSGQCTQDEFEEAKKMAIEALESQDRQVIIAGSYLLEGEDNVPDTNVGDIISRQASIEIIKNYCENGCDIAEDNWCPSCRREKFVELLKALPSAQPELITVNIDHELTQEEYEKLRKDMANAPVMLLPPEQRWIPCSEKLPDGRLNNSYLVQDKDGKRAVGTYTYWGWVFGHYMNDPVAWMPLPEPYKTT